MSPGSERHNATAVSACTRLQRGEGAGYAVRVTDLAQEARGRPYYRRVSGTSGHHRLLSRRLAPLRQGYDFTVVFLQILSRIKSKLRIFYFSKKTHKLLKYCGISDSFKVIGKTKLMTFGSKLKCQRLLDFISFACLKISCLLAFEMRCSCQMSYYMAGESDLCLRLYLGAEVDVGNRGSFCRKNIYRSLPH